MSGDVQPRKRKDKKKKKDDLGIEEPRGTAAALGEGDVFMHSHHDHGTGGHWCAKVIFFSLLAVLVTLIGLIILENRGLSDLEANSVESRYSGVLEGWLEEGHDDDHHDQHTLELNHHDDEDDDEDHSGGLDNDDDHDVSQEDEEDDEDDDQHSHEADEEEDDDQNSHESDEEQDEEQTQDADDEINDQDDDDDDDERNQEDDDDDEDDDESNEGIKENDDEQDQEDADHQADDDDNDSEEQNLDTAEDEDEVEEPSYRRYYQSTENQAKDDDDDDDDEQKSEDGDYDQSVENDNDDQQDEAYNDSQENDDDDNQNENANEGNNENSDENDQDEDDEDHEDHNDHQEDESDVELEHIEEEVFDEDVSKETPARRPQESDELSKEADPIADTDEDEIELLESDELDDLPEELPIPVPKGRPLVEVEEAETEKPQDTLADEEEYERQQEALRKEKEQASQGTEGGNSIEDEWPGEPSDAYWRDELDHAERDLRQGEWTAAAERASAAKLRQSARARYIVARALDSAAEAKRDNSLLTKAIAAYLELLKMNEKLADKKLIEVADRALDRMKFRGNYLGTEPLYRLLIRRFPDDPMHRNNLTVSFLMANRVDLAEEVIKETLKRWPNDRLAMVHYGFILKTLHNKHEEAVDAFTIALEGDTGPACEPRFYYHLGDSLLLLGRFKEAHEVHKRGAKLGHFLSPAQRSLYNVDRLKSQPWWDVEKTPYVRLARALEKSWKEILKEGRAAQELYEKEKEGLKERGEWSQLDLFVQGREVPNRCSRAPVTCSIVRSVTAASGCRRGQVKFSSMEAGTHVRPHVGPTNCRLRMHLGLSNTKDTYIRVDQETRQWQTGKVLMFDDSFEHEVWHNGTGARLVLIVDVWHPDLTRTERAQLPAI